MDIHSLSQQLLERIANSIHDRDPNRGFCFTSAELCVVENFIAELTGEKKAPKVEQSGLLGTY